MEEKLGMSSTTCHREHAAAAGVAIQPLDRARGPDPSTLLRVILSLSMDELVEGLDCVVPPWRSADQQSRNDGWQVHRSRDGGRRNRLIAKAMRGLNPPIGRSFRLAWRRGQE
jgi:hypothetical protein